MSRERWAVLVVVLAVAVYAAAYFTNGGAVLSSFLQSLGGGDASAPGAVMERNATGAGPDVWLVKNASGSADRVGLIFGYDDDYSACLEIAGLLGKRYPVDGYDCVIATD